MLVTGGSTDVTTYFVLRLVADGTEATGLTITNFDLQYTRSGATPAAKVDATALGAANSAHADNQAIEIDATDQPGLYRVDWPDAAFAAGVREVILSVKCATAFTEHLRVQIDPPVNTVQVGGTTQTARDIGASVLLSSGTGTGQLKLASGYVAMTWADIAAPTTTVNLSGTTIATTQKVDVETIKTNPVVNGGTVTFPTGATLASTTNITAGTLTTVTTATNVTTVNGLAANVITAASIANGAIDAATFAADVDAEILSYLVDDATRIDASALNTLSGHDPGETIMGATDLGTGASLTSLASAANLAIVAGYVDTEITTIITHLTDIKGATFVGGTDSLEAIRDRGDAAWVTATGFSTHTAADVWAVGTRLLTAGTNIVLAKGVGVTGFNDLSAAQANAEADTAIADAALATAAAQTTLSTLLGRVATTTIGTISGAGTGTEVFVHAGVTATVVVDASGNRASVTFS